MFVSSSHAWLIRRSLGIVAVVAVAQAVTGFAREAQPFGEEVMTAPTGVPETAAEVADHSPQSEWWWHGQL